MNEQITFQLSRPGCYQPNWTLAFCPLAPNGFFFLTDPPKRTIRVRAERIKALLDYKALYLYILSINDSSVESLDHRSANPC